MLALMGCLCLEPPAQAGLYMPPGHHVYAGLSGGPSLEPYQRLTHSHPAVFDTYITWNTSTAWLRARRTGFRSRLALHISTAPGYKQAGVISPQQIALGHSDRFLVHLGRNIAQSRRIVYIRIMGEPNGHWNAYAAFNANGTVRSGNSPHWYIQAWRRTALILRGGPTAAINRKLEQLRLPTLRAAGHAKSLARPKAALLWVPQDAGSPEIAANAPGVFWPGSAYVDWVGTDFYGTYPNFTLLDDYYNSFTGKPFVISEWGVQSDDPSFVRELFAWIHTHPRVRLIDYYQGFGPPSRNPYDLANYPRTQRALRRALSSQTFLAYPPEYAHPPRHKKKGSNPPHNPGRGAPPTSPPSAPPSLCLPLLRICIPL